MKYVIRISLAAAILIFLQKTAQAADAERESLPQLIAGINDKYAQKRCNSLECLIVSCGPLCEDEKLKRVNDFFNQIPYESDIRNWGVDDYWAAPLETLIKGRGDCEDYAIAKFCTLVKLGIPQEKIYLTYVKIAERKEPHFVVTYYESDEAVPRVLDNRKHEILTVQPGNVFEIVYRFNLKEFISHRGTQQMRQPLETVRFRKWKELSRRLRLI
jgi:predicted transglutaminase-like cysteine proteinase